MSDSSPPPYDDKICHQSQFVKSGCWWHLTPTSHMLITFNICKCILIFLRSLQQIGLFRSLARCLICFQVLLSRFTSVESVCIVPVIDGRPVRLCNWGFHSRAGDVVWLSPMYRSNPSPLTELDFVGKLICLKRWICSSFVMW